MGLCLSTGSSFLSALTSSILCTEASGCAQWPHVYKASPASACAEVLSTGLSGPNSGTTAMLLWLFMEIGTGQPCALKAHSWALQFAPRSRSTPCGKEQPRPDRDTNEQNPEPWGSNAKLRIQESHQQKAKSRGRNSLWTAEEPVGCWYVIFASQPGSPACWVCLKGSDTLNLPCARNQSLQKPSQTAWEKRDLTHAEHGYSQETWVLQNLTLAGSPAIVSELRGASTARSNLVRS